jgi:hypothetical protein
MARQAADQYKKTATHDEQAAHLHKQTRRAMRQTTENRTHPTPCLDKPASHCLPSEFFNTTDQY